MDNYLEHHGILGQKWGVRRYQNPDGTLTSAGKKRYSEKSDSRAINKETAKKVAIGLAGVTVAAVTAAYVAKNPEAVKSVINKAKDLSSKTLSKKSISNGKNFVKKSSKDMSDAELSEAVRRMNLEAQYNKLNAQRNPKKISKVVKTVAEVNTAAATAIGLYRNADQIKRIVKDSTNKKTKRSNQNG